LNPVDPQRLTGFEQLTKKNYCSNGVEQMKNCVNQFFEQTNFEQLIMTRIVAKVFFTQKQFIFPKMASVSRLM
jgi:hypothetical protein